MKIRASLLAIIVCCIQLWAQGETSSSAMKASAVLEKAYKEAKKSNKNVFLIFHASWCGWCKKMEANMNSKECKALFDRNYITAYLDVLERGKNKKLENPGAELIRKKYKGDKQGIPFWVVLDKNGKLLEDSLNDKGQNLGCPYLKEEVAKFISILKKTSDLSDEELKIISNKFSRR